MSGYLAVPLGVSRDITHHIYLRRHISRDNDGECLIFVANLPRDTTIDNIKDICKSLGDTILSNFIYQGNNHGLIELVDESACERFLSKAKKLSKSDSCIVWSLYGARGSEGYLARHMAQYPPESELQERVDAYMEDFNHAEEIQEQEAQAAAGQVDDDGFTLVGVPKRKTQADVQASQPPAKKKKSLEKQDFYRFQIRERQKQEMSDLLKRYQDDKEKVEQLKQKKHFNPY